MAKTKRRKEPAWRRHLRFGLEYGALLGLYGLFRILPIDAASALMGWCWRHTAPHLHRHPRALANLAEAMPALSAEERERIVRAMWDNLGRVFAESLMLDRIIADPSRIDDRAAAALAQARSAGTGMVCVSMHTGNWELVVTPVLRAGLSPVGIYQRLKNPLVDRFVLGMRRTLFPRGLFAKGTDIGRPLFKIVRQGGTLAMMADLRDRRGLPVPFFGRPAPSTAFPALLARGTQARMMIARSVRLGGARFAIEGRELPVPHTDDREADVAALTADIQAQFEAWIRETPEQWMWSHRRWG